ncbi:MAG: group 1 glycosyl [Prolixibacteraceae bacterium]|nr:MAG: group 1 glycosyl [Prolixibacteraceae bacterium]
MPTIFQICVEGNTGSTGRIAEEIGILAIQKGWNSYIAYGRFPRQSKSNLIRIGTDLEVYLHGIETRLFDRHCLGSKTATQNLVKQIKEIKPDIIHLHHLHGYYINIEILFDFLANVSIPVVWTFHDCWSITGHCAYFDFANCNKWKTECNNCPEKRVYPASFFIDRSRKNYYLKKALFTSVKKMVVVPVSDWLKNIVLESFMKDIPVQTIHNGIDISVFKPQENNQETREKLGINGRFMLLGVASPWNRRKGLGDFIQLSKLLNEDEVIVLVGLNDTQLKQLPKNIIGLTKTENRKELINMYSTADLFINPTWEDNFPTTNLEALACGTPVVTYRTGGSIEAISSDTGFVTDKGDIPELIKVIRNVKEKGKKSFSNTCRNRADELFNKDDRFKEYMDLYESLVLND